MASLHRLSCPASVTRRPFRPAASARAFNVRCTALPTAPRAMWTRPGQDQGDFIKPSYIPQPSRTPEYAPRRDESPEYRPMNIPEFQPREQPDRSGEMPEPPPMPARPRDPLPAGPPGKRERPGKEGEEEEKREAPAPEKGGGDKPSK